VALPQSRDEFKEYVLRRLGAPVIRINCEDQQIEDRIDDAISFWQDYHCDATEKVYLAHQITSQDILNRYVTVPDAVVGITRMFPVSTMLGSSSLFSLNFQFAQSDFLSSALTGSMIPLWMALTHIELIQQILIGNQPLRFNRHTNKVKIDMDWTKFAVGDYLVLEGYQVLDPDVYSDIWKDKFLLRYATALVKRQWGENISKFSGMQMAGGTAFNGDRIRTEAMEDIEELERSMIERYSAPIEVFYG
jgi:hypothetical protein